MILRPGTFLQNRYEILARIGSGGMSDVYKAKCHKLNRFVAIKLLKSEFSEDAGFVSKFKMEAQAAAGLSHPNIVNVYDVIDEEELHYIVMELIEGVTLKNYIESRGRLDINEAIGISIQVALGIKAAHESKIIHRDIKPQNIIISNEGKVKVADFGIARAVSSQTLTSTAMGSVHYISPEQAKGGYSDERSDIYSLGVSMYEMLTGKLPFSGSTTVAVALAHLEQSPVHPSVHNPAISPSLERIILKCMQKKQERRYENISDLITDLRKCLVMSANSPESKEEDSDPSSDTQVFSKGDLLRINAGRDLQAKEEEEEEDFPKKREKLREKDENTRMDRLMSAAGLLAALLLVGGLIFIILILSGTFTKKKNQPSGPIIIESSTGAEPQEDKLVEVPDVVTMDKDLAEDRLKGFLLQMKVKSSAYDDEIPQNSIISQEPKAGEKVEKYAKIEVVLSLGPDKIDIEGMGIADLSREEVKVRLEGEGLAVSFEEEFSEEIEEGKMIRFEPKAPKKGGKITVFYSKGKEVLKVLVPDISGKPEKDAIQALSDAKLVPGEVKKDYSASVAKGSLISQSPEAGDSVDEGSRVSYFLSLGPVPETTKAYKYIASIDNTYNISDLIGPGSATTSVTIMVRLRQTVNGETKYSTLMEPRKVTGDTILPVRFKSIEGAYGVDQGFVEVVVIQGEEHNVLKSYTVEFFKVE
ncbi:MAG: Stk1 family PASTA domain-containing Ser/Thr kinase [Johnsonella sp.]|nr:Stk1 family PASTA domain-containing Ser/Thr kinase [Johnsonella sp.]